MDEKNTNINAEAINNETANQEVAEEPTEKKVTLKKVLKWTAIAGGTAAVAYLGYKLFKGSDAAPAADSPIVEEATAALFNLL